MLSQAEIDSFAANGYVAVRDALPADVAGCQDEIWSELGDRGVRRENPSTWRDPVVRINCPDSEAFAAAGTQPVLWEAFDQLIGEGRWWRRRGVGGTIPVRFPSQDDPGDAGWHIEASFEKNGDWWVNYRSRQRGLLALYLFSDVDADGAPTRVRPGSHRDAAHVLASAGDEGVPFPQASADRPMALATGRAGDVMLFLSGMSSLSSTGKTARVCPVSVWSPHQPRVKSGSSWATSMSMATRYGIWPVMLSSAAVASSRTAPRPWLSLTGGVHRTRSASMI